MELMAFVPLLGREIGDPDLKEALAGLGAKMPLVTEEALETEYLELKNAGISLAFEAKEEVRQSLPYQVRAGALVLVNVTAYGANELEYATFAGTLPQGLNFASSRAAVAAALGRPDDTSPVMPIDVWHRSDHRLIIDFDDGGTRIVSVALELP